MKEGPKFSLKRIAALIPVIILMIVVGLSYDYYFDLNDDVLMKDILSGTYSSEPLAHNMQMLWPLCAPVTLLYRMVPHVSWYGIMLVGFQYASLYVIIDGISKICSEKTNELSDPKKWFFKPQFARPVVYFISMLVIASLMFTHLIYVQYTVTVAMMSGAAAVRFFNADTSGSLKESLKAFCPGIVIIVLAFNLRTEMMLLMLPFVGAVLVYKLSFEEKIFKNGMLKKYIYALLLILLFMFIFWYIDSMAYGTPGWRAFRNMFDSRTILYDYSVPPPYEGNESFYDMAGLTPEEAVLFENYNYGIDPRIDDRMMRAVATHAKYSGKNDRSFSDKLKDKIRIYIYEITHLNDTPGTDHPWNMVALILYVSCALVMIFGKDIFGLWRIVALFAGRSAIWLYMLMGERTPDRITHSLYFMEITVLMILFMALLQRSDLTGDKRIKTVIMAATAALLCAGICIIIPGRKEASYQAAYREQVNAPYIELYEYMAGDTEKMFLIDTYSSVSYSEKMFDDIAFVSKANSNVLGGWAATSPIEKDKLAAYGIEDMGSGLLSDNVLFCKKTDSDAGWMKDYYSSIGIDVTMEKEKTIADTFELIRVKKVEN
ncbi:MAG: hypothetical protein K5888_05930 [Lachnospiraceae bacterium]|nr:hypothetical protein [Lachnospiraceae bacterium]